MTISILEYILIVNNLLKHIFNTFSKKSIIPQKKISSNKKMSLNKVNAMKFIIGKNNFTKLLNEKKPEGYGVFFTKYYLKKDIKSDKG